MSNCVFCKIIDGAIPSKKIYEDDEMLAFHDVSPQAPIHFLVIPKKHVPNIMEMEEADSILMGKILYKAQSIAKELGCEENGARFVINCKSDGGQTVDHIHLHVLGGRSLDWPPG
jgi:histidine triad (HIT) family protein